MQKDAQYPGHPASPQPIGADGAHRVFLSDGCDRRRVGKACRARAGYHDDVTRYRIVPLMLALALVWQALALGRPGSSVNVLLDAAHAVLHWQGIGHHHHDDGSVQLDESPDASRHLLTDHAGGFTGLPAAQPGAPAPVASSMPCVRPAGAGPPPFLEGPLKPPRLPA